jgi:hypothetical protein
MRIRLILLILFIAISCDIAAASTPSKIYKKNKNNILESNFLIFDEQIFVVIRLKTKASSAGKRALFIKMKTRSLKSLLPRFAHYQFPNADTAWFDIYFSKPVSSQFTIKQAFVVDKKLADGEAYLVLTVPQASVESYIPDIKVIKNKVNRAFDEGELINLNKYLGLVEGKRLRRVKKAIKAKISKLVENKKNLSSSDNENSNINDQSTESSEETIITENSDTNDQPSESSEETITKKALNNQIECDLPLCEKINKKKINKDSSKGTTTKDETKEIFKGTTIRKSNDLDDFFE